MAITGNIKYENLHQNVKDDGHIESLLPFFFGVYANLKDGRAFNEDIEFLEGFDKKLLFKDSELVDADNKYEIIEEGNLILLSNKINGVDYIFDLGAAFEILNENKELFSEVTDIMYDACMDDISFFGKTFENLCKETSFVDENDKEAKVYHDVFLKIYHRIEEDGKVLVKKD